MSDRKKIKKSLKAACWACGLTVADLCRELGISRQTAYDAWRSPDRFPIAAPKISERLNITHEKNAVTIAC